MKFSQEQNLGNSSGTLSQRESVPLELILMDKALFEALAQADHELRIEGLRSSDFAAPLFEALARGEITLDELRDRLTAHYRSDLDQPTHAEE